LNRLIIARLPLALPPHTSNPSIYASGLLYIAPIYIKFESLWQNLLSTGSPTNASAEQRYKSCDEDTLSKALPPNSSSFLSAQQPKLCNNTSFILSQLLLPELLRSERLRSDIKLLLGKRSQEVDEQLSHISQNAPALTKFIEHIENSIVAKPHVLVAYAWVFYMALFSGGRYIRGLLQSAGTDFWLQSPSQSVPTPQTPQDIINTFLTTQKTSLTDMHDRVLSHVKELTLSFESYASEKATTQTSHQFFHFPGVKDGEDIKREFKKRVADIDILLADEEKDEIVQEAQHIFNFMVGIASDLDAVCNTNVEQRKEKHSEGSASMRMEAGYGIATIAREWLSGANLPLRSGSQSGRKSSIFDVASSMVNLGIEALWQYI
jgi:heme oxygenase